MDDDADVLEAMANEANAKRSRLTHKDRKQVAANQPAKPKARTKCTSGQKSVGSGMGAAGHKKTPKVLPAKRSAIPAKKRKLSKLRLNQDQ